MKLPIFNNQFLNKKFYPKHCKMPDEKFLASPGNKKGTGPYWGSYFPSNYLYSDLRGKTWQEADSILQAETEVIAKFASMNINLQEFEELMNAAQRSDTFKDYIPELGTISLIYVLSAMGCAPISSCRAHGDYIPGQGGKEPQPLISFFAPKQLAEKIYKSVELVKNSGMKINMSVSQAFPFDDYSFRPIIIAASNIGEFMTLAGILYTESTGESNPIVPNYKP